MHGKGFPGSGKPFFTMKVPDSSHEPERACTRRDMDIGRASRYVRLQRLQGEKDGVYTCKKNCDQK